MSQAQDARIAELERRVADLERLLRSLTTDDGRAIHISGTNAILKKP